MLKSAFKNRNHDIMELILRDVSLQKAVVEGDSNELNKEFTKRETWLQKQASLKAKRSSHAGCDPTRMNYHISISQIDDDQSFSRNSMLKSKPKKSVSNCEQLSHQDERINSKLVLSAWVQTGRSVSPISSTIETVVSKIQKSVRAWLLWRHE